MTRKKNPKKSIRVIDGTEDLYAVFSPDGPPPEGPEADFAALLEESLGGQDMRHMLEEKGSGSSTVQQEALRDLMRQYPSAEDEIDLHGLTACAAVARAEAFIRSAQLRGLRTVRIIVGRGLHSQGRPVLPDSVERTVVALKKSGPVLTFAWEKRAKRQSGALIVYLKGSERCGRDG